MFFYLAQIIVIADVVPNSVLVFVCVSMLFTRKGLNNLKGFQNRTGIVFASTQFTDLSIVGTKEESFYWAMGKVPGTP
jgi:hypothetical protein